MRFCDEHWEDLKNALEERELSHLISKTAKEAVFRYKTASPNNYDPLIRANLLIVAEVMKQGGSQVRQDQCPLCEARRLSKDEELPSRWIKGCTDAILRDCRERDRLDKTVLM